MLGSNILDIVIGMVFVFLLLSLVCSGLNEMLETIIKNRAKDLEKGIAELVGDPDNGTKFLDEFYNHGLINSLYRGFYPPKSKSDLPSYIPATSFALAVMDLAKNPPAGATKLPPNLQAALAIFEKSAAGNAARLQASLEAWFNHGMNRVTGWYKRRSVLILVALGLVVAVALNADAVRIARSISNDASLRQALVAAAQAQAGQSLNAAGTGAAQAGAGAQATISQIRSEVTELGTLGLPMGWQQSELMAADTAPTQRWFIRGAVLGGNLASIHLLGWLLTAIAISMGAPFWFDLLNRFVAVRSTLKPQAQVPAPEEAAASPQQPIVLTLPGVMAPVPVGLPVGSLPPAQAAAEGPPANSN